MPIKILQKEALVLRQVAQPVPIQDIKSAKIKKVLAEMKEALNLQDDGVAIAAPQIGHSLRIFIVSHRVEEIISEAKESRSKTKQEKIEGDLAFKPLAANNLVFINPVMKKLSKERKSVEEGCLSVRYLYGQVKRSTKATVIAFDENGKKFERGGTGLIAQIFQHEMDHLDGVLFIDKAQNIEEIFPEEYKKNAKSRKTK